MTIRTTSNGARARAAAALRTLGHRLVDHEADEALLAEIATRAGELTAAVVASPRVQRFIADDLGHNGLPPANGEPMDHYPACPVSGQENPLGLAIRLRREDDCAVATVRFDAACAGLPEITHGGAVAAVFDDLMGFVLVSLNLLVGYTARLTVSYRAPVPLRTEIEFRGRLTRHEGRKLFIEATARAASSGQLLAEAEGLFIEADVNGA